MVSIDADAATRDGSAVNWQPVDELGDCFGRRVLCGKDATIARFNSTEIEIIVVDADEPAHAREAAVALKIKPDLHAPPA